MNKHTGRGRDRMGNGAKDGLRFKWSWKASHSGSTRIQRKACRTCITIHPPLIGSGWSLSVNPWSQPGKRLLYEGNVFHGVNLLAIRTLLPARLEAQLAAEALFEKILTDSLRDCFGYEIEIHQS